MKKLSSKNVPVFALALCVLSGCEMAKKEEQKSSEKAAQPAAAAPAVGTEQKTDSSPVLFKIKGKPVITEQSFKEYKDKFAQLQPQYAPLLEDPSIEQQLFLGQKNEALLTEWAKENNLEKSPKFQQDLNDMIELGKRSLYVRYFQDAHPVKISDAEIKQYYEENKNTPQLMVAQGGIDAEVVMFDNKEKAQAFYEKVKDNAAKFADVAKEQQANVKKLGYVNKQSFEVEGPVREKVLAVKAFPAVEFVDLKNNKYAVVHAIEKKEAQYVPFEDVKEGIRRFLEQQKGNEALMKELGDLEKKYGAEASDYFERKIKAKEEEQKKMVEQMKKQQPEQPQQKASAPQPA